MSPPANMCVMKPGPKARERTPDWLAERYHIDPASGCWVWQLGLNRQGYGCSTDANTTFISSHRLSYIIHKGQIPAGLEIDHLCRNTSCCNPDHLEAVTKSVNLRRGNMHHKYCAIVCNKCGEMMAGGRGYIETKRDGSKMMRCTPCRSKRRMELWRMKRAQHV